MPIFIIISIVIGCLLAGLFFWIDNKIAKKRQVLRELEIQAENTQTRIEAFESTLQNMQNRVSDLETTIAEDQVIVDGLNDQKKELNNDIATRTENVEKLKSLYQTVEDEYKKKYMAERKEWLDERQAEYISMQEDFVDQFREENKKKLDVAQELTERITDLRAKVAAATQVAKQHAEEDDFDRYHSVELGDSAKADIRRIEDVLGFISDEAGSAIAKVIWKVYYEKPVSDLCGRVVGGKRRTGIYKITNTNTQMCYVGQAVDIAERWKQHIKRALNAEPRTQNKLYPAMYKEGIENFTFEIVEECDQSKLNEREDFWQDFYKAKEYGYSIK